MKKILFVAAESTPYFSTGGLADVVYGLAREIGFIGKNDVRIILPNYRVMDQPARFDTVISKKLISLDSYKREASLYKIEGKPIVYLVNQEYYFRRDDYYGYIDDYERFIFFSRAVMDIVASNDFAQKENNWFPDIIQGFDWVAGFFPALLEEYRKKEKKYTRTRFSLYIHNLRKLGIFSSRALYLIGERDNRIFPEICETPEQINFLGRGILQADRVVTANPNFDQVENRLPEAARRLERAFEARRGTTAGGHPALVGIPSAIDEKVYNPDTDPAIHNFNAGSIDARVQNKLVLQKELSLRQDARIPLIGMVTRLIPENGIELIPAIQKHLAELGEIQLAILAEPGDAMHKSLFETWDREQDKDHPWIKCRFTRDPRLARLIYASCDIYLVPAREMPSGISHLIAMRYGAVPLARSTGSLSKSIIAYQPGMELRRFSNPGVGAGFKFEAFSKEALLNCLKQALNLYRNDEDTWKEIQVFNLRQHFSWEKSANQYLDLYDEMLKEPGEACSLQQGISSPLEKEGRLLQAVQEIDNLPGLGIRDSKMILKQAARLVRWVLKCDAVYVREMVKRHQLSAGHGETDDFYIVESSLDETRYPNKPADEQIVSIFRSSTESTWHHLGDVDRNGNCQPITGLESSPVAREFGWNTGWTAPLVAHGRLLGWIDVFFMEQSEDAAWLPSALTILANSFALRTDAIRISSEMDLITRLGCDLHETLSVQDVLEKACRWAEKIVPDSEAWGWTVEKGALQASGKPIENARKAEAPAAEAYMTKSMIYLPDWSEAPRGKDGHRLYRSLLALPIQPVTDTNYPAKPEPAGMLVVVHPRSAAISRDDEHLLVRNLAPEAYAALRTKRALAELEHSRATKLEKLLNSLTAGVNFDQLLNRVIEETARVLNAEAAALYLIEPLRDRLEIQAAFGYQSKLLAEHVTYEKGEGITGWIAETGQTFKADSLNELHRHPFWKGKKNKQYHVQEPSAFLGLPLKVSDRVIGVLKLEDRSPENPIKFFSDDDQHLAEMMANVIATVVYNAKHNENQLRDLSSKLSSLSQSLVGSPDRQTLMNNIVETTLKVLNVDSATLFLSDEENKVLTIAAAAGYQTPLLEAKASYKFGEGVTGRIAETNQAFQANNIDALRDRGGSKAGKYDKLVNFMRPEAFYGLPLNVAGREKVLGVLKVESLKPRPFTNEDVLLIEMMGSIIAAVVYNAQQADNRLRDFSSKLSKLSQSLSGSQNWQTLMNNIVETTSKVLNVDSATLFLSDEENKVLTIAAAAGYQTPLLEAKASYKFGEGVTGRIAEINQAFQANNIDALRDRGGSKAGKYDKLVNFMRPEAFYGLPLNVAGREKVLGVLKVESLKPRPFTEEDVLLIEMMGNIIATVVYNAQQAENRLRDLSSKLRKLSGSLSGSPNLPALLDNIVSATAQMMNVDSATLFLSDEENRVLTIAAAWGYQRPLLSVKASYHFGEGVTGRIAETNQPFQANNLDVLRNQGGSRAGKYDHLVDFKRPNAFYGLPLNVAGREKPLGVLKVEGLKPRTFTDEDVLLIEMMGRIIANLVHYDMLTHGRLSGFVRGLGSFTSPLTTHEVLARLASGEDNTMMEVLAGSLAAAMGDNLDKGYQEGLALLHHDAAPEIYGRVAETAASNNRLLFNLFNQAAHTANLETYQLENIFRLSYDWAEIQGGGEAGTFDLQARAFIDLFATIGQATRTDSLSDGKWHAFLLDTSRTFKGTYLPQRLFFIFNRDGMVDEQVSLDDLFLLPGRFPKTNEKVIALLPVWGDKTRVDRSRDALAKHYRGMFNFIIVEVEDLMRVAAAPNPEPALQHFIHSKANLESISPYQDVGPTSSLIFFGREKELDKISQDIHRASFAIVGTRRIGKTSILNKLHSERLPRLGLRSLFVDCARAKYDQFLEAPLLPTWQPDTPQDAPRTLNDILQGKFPRDKHLVLLLDEADKIIPDDSKNGWALLNQLRAQANAGMMSFILCGERTLQESLHDSRGPGFNLSNEIILPHLDEKAVRGLVTEPMKRLEISFSDEEQIVSTIFNFTAGHPNVVQRLCRRIIEALNEQQSRRITLDMVNQIIADPEFISEDFLETYLASTTVLEQLCVYLMAADPALRSLQQVYASLTQRKMSVTLNEVESALRRLVTLRGILQATSGGYDFAASAFTAVLSRSRRLGDMIALCLETYAAKGDIVPEKLSL